MTTHTHTEQHHITTNKTYIIVWIILMILTAITVYVSYINFGILNIVIALVVASIKASVVALYFMHLKFEDSITWVFALFPLSLLALLIAMTITDTFTRVVLP
ncbi:MAG TPA: cytochrome C oxidase subunit IV family protein [Thermodesulfobacteriota bacterium]|nr:cytochrome C oxidase subunit IV family protein [Thermodesulfobacteriota bacterium]